MLKYLVTKGSGNTRDEAVCRLITEVNAALEKDWSLEGGVFLSESHGWYIAYQAMSFMDYVGAPKTPHLPL